MQGVDATPSAGNYQFELVRVIADSRGNVYRAWTDRDLLERWLCRDGDKNLVRIRKFDLRPTGGFRVEVTRGTEVYLVFGTYEELTPGERLVFSWAWERTLPNTGKLTSEAPTRVTVDLVQRPDGTELHLTQTGFSDLQLRNADRDVWKASFVALAEVLREKSRLTPG
jgi:uncharacterized protein YndB with AHSA1/START domain